MWLLSTARAELKYFVGPEDVPDGYAILSHVWQGDEQSFKDIQDLQQRCAEEGTNPRDYASEKIKRLCQLAELHGYAWAWADACCIDKSSSSELSEAINSMYRYYTLARVCYVYLHDVPSREHRRRFQTSKWHSRGWTLQELIAPATVFFLSAEWDLLGTKLDFSRTLTEITNIPQEVLTLAKDVRDISIAQRMSWAARRQTTRPEDEAYCLMGIFGINMPTLYGEGRAAFRRLQEEIMKKSVDTSLFAWGFNVHYVQPCTSTRCTLHSRPNAHLFAMSPRDFLYSEGISTPQIHDHTIRRTRSDGGPSRRS
ncbi:hypothetical protein L226DRAFT_543822 [Lentinus tigrinus ALCF2SS1-7]|uniref:uncharacterized protein n=1 Tax=Lentinus tigrinus ALCF2SS1-7 TaxID=1328758 RepID=UPI00116628E0|nr:hypothetical protein L226DRAFT_543822 [Lentinus tigrinus ALCF2SS1-7]